MSLKKLMNSIEGKRILVTGGGGSIGSEIVRQLAMNNKIFVLDQDETATFRIMQEFRKKWVKGRVGDIRNKYTVHDVFSDFKPQLVFHAAAYKHVSTMEIYPIEAIETNALGTYNVLSEAQRYECLEKFVYISTDKVVNAVSVMGATKKLGEIIVKNSGGIVVRFGNVLWSRGSVFEIWEKQWRNNEPLTITDKRMERYTMSIPEAVALVLKAAQEGNGGEIFIMDMGERKNIMDILHDFLGTKPDGNLVLPPIVEEIGLRPGEAMTERLMTVEEESVAVKKGKFWIIK